MAIKSGIPFNHRCLLPSKGRLTSQSIGRWIGGLTCSVAIELQAADLNDKGQFIPDDFQQGPSVMESFRNHYLREIIPESDITVKVCRGTRTPGILASRL